MKKRIFITAALILILCITFVGQSYGASYIYYGSKEYDTIKTIQRKLKNWGYYTGNVDGIFGYKTEQAVKYFQRTNGLTVDGKVGNQTLKALGMSASNQGSNSSSSQSSGSSGGYSESDINLIARVVYGEARGEPYTGKVAVAAVILNRVKSSSFPNSVSGVVYQNGAFDAVADGQYNLTPDSSAVKAVKDAINGWDPTYGSIYYYNPKTATNQWIRTRPIVVTIGNHVFCK